MITFVTPGQKSREVTCDGCGKKVSETDAYFGSWLHFGTEKTRKLPINGKDFCPECQKKYKVHDKSYLIKLEG